MEGEAPDLRTPDSDVLGPAPTHRSRRAPSPEAAEFRWVRLGLDLVRIASACTIVLIAVFVSEVSADPEREDFPRADLALLVWMGTTLLGLATCVAAPRLLGLRTRVYAAAGAASLGILIADEWIRWSAEPIVDLLIPSMFFVSRLAILLILRRITRHLGRDALRVWIDRTVFGLALFTLGIAGVLAGPDAIEATGFERVYAISLAGLLCVYFFLEPILLFKVRRAIATSRLRTLSEVFD